MQPTVFVLVGGTIESLAPEFKDLHTGTEMTELMQYIFSLAEVQASSSVSHGDYPHQPKPEQRKGAEKPMALFHLSVTQTKAKRSTVRHRFCRLPWWGAIV